MVPVTADGALAGVSCSSDGVSVGGVALLERDGEFETGAWRPRALEALNRDLTERFGIPIEFTRALPGVAALGRALNAGDVARAQLITLLLKIPDPPDLAKSQRRTAAEVASMAQRLHVSGILKSDWDSTKHPRWPAGSSGGIGGEFAPGGTETTGASLIPAQIAIPFPSFDTPMPEETATPRPFEILPPPVTLPNTNPKDVPKNPYPSRKKCVKEWAEAEKFCNDLRATGKLGRYGYRGFGTMYYQCLLGQVSEDCGGNRTSA